MSGEWLKINNKAAIFYVVLFLFILGFSTTASNYDLDLWARLIAGMGFVQTGHVLKQDFLSYTPTHVWYDHEWGSGVVFYLVHQMFGVAGFLFLQTALVFLIFFTVLKIIKLRGTTTTTPYNFLFYYFSYMTFCYVADMPVRCQLFSFLFFTVFLYILESARRGKQKYLWFLPPIMLIWNNLHGGCVVGIGLIGLYIIGEFINRKLFNTEAESKHNSLLDGGLGGKWNPPYFHDSSSALIPPLCRNYIYALLGTLAVLPINPWGFGYLCFLFKANTMSRDMIIEWLGLFSKNTIISNITFKFKIFALVLLFVEAIFVVKQIFANAEPQSKPILPDDGGLVNPHYCHESNQALIAARHKNCKFDFTKFLVVLTTLFFAILHVKLIPFAVISMTCFFYDDFYTIFNVLTKNLFNKIATVKDTLVYVLIIVFSISAIKTNGFGPYLNCLRFPLRTVEFIKINSLKGNILQDFSNGSYVSYKLYPNNRIFMDGRYEEVYYPNLLSLYNDFCTVNSNWNNLLRLYPPDIIILGKNYPAFKLIKADKHWKAAFDDGASVVFIKSSDVKRHYKQPSNDINYYKKTLFDTNIDLRSK